jgi:hypothetical protein
MVESWLRRFIAVATPLLIAGVLACGGTTNPTGASSTGGATTSPGNGSGGGSNGSGSNGSGSNGSGSNGGSSGGSSSSPATGSLAIRITDSPFTDAKALLVTFSEVNVHRSDVDSWQTVPFASGTSRTCDLKKLQGPTDVLGVGSLPAGHYTQVRLVVSSANIYFDNPSSGPACAPSIAAPAGKSASVDVPSGEVKLNHEFTITSGATTMLLDFDGDQSVKQTGSDNGNGKGNSNTKYLMTPVIRIVSVQ